MFIHHLLFGTAALIGACLIYEPRMQLLLYSALSNEFQHWLSFLICFVEEMQFIMMMIGVAAPTWQLQVIFFGLIENQLKMLVKALSANTT